MQNEGGAPTMFPSSKHTMPKLPNVIRTPNYLIRTKQMIVS